jgi:hypothetical protein
MQLSDSEWEKIIREAGSYAKNPMPRRKDKEGIVEYERRHNAWRNELEYRHLLRLER